MNARVGERVVIVTEGAGRIAGTLTSLTPSELGVAEGRTDDYLRARIDGDRVSAMVSR